MLTVKLVDAEDAVEAVDVVGASHDADVCDDVDVCKQDVVQVLAKACVRFDCVLLRFSELHYATPKRRYTNSLTALLSKLARGILKVLEGSCSARSVVISDSAVANML